ncbi:MAG: DUF2911 domain-containing protein [Acidobacteria bacterium]|jgi:hypothetical protein|nr:DUF2911 domain-containing protein [Acidobacteriota bacterium]
MQKRIVLMTCFLLLASLSFAQQDKSKRPSPPASAECKFSDGKTIKTDYSSPRMKGRKIYGGLVPYGKIWRTGANEATTFVTDTDVTIGGKPVPAGSYTLFTVPGESSWTVVISKKTGEWGTDYGDPGNDQARAEMKTAKTSAPVENFTLGYDAKGGVCTLHLDWENTRASVDIHEKK